MTKYGRPALTLAWLAPPSILLWWAWPHWNAISPFLQAFIGASGAIGFAGVTLALAMQSVAPQTHDLKRPAAYLVVYVCLYFGVVFGAQILYPPIVMATIHYFGPHAPHLKFDLTSPVDRVGRVFRSALDDVGCGPHWSSVFKDEIPSNRDTREIFGGRRYRVILELEITKNSSDYRAQAYVRKVLSNDTNAGLVGQTIDLKISPCSAMPEVGDSGIAMGNLAGEYSRNPVLSTF